MKISWFVDSLWKVEGVEEQEKTENLEGKRGGLGGGRRGGGQG